MTKKATTDPVAVAGASPVLALAGVAAALIGLAQSVAAVARFPNTPVPPSLVDRIGAAEDALRAAVEDLPASLAIGATASPYDDDWIRERFESLDQALAEKLDTLADAQAVAEGLAERDKAISGFGADLARQAERIDALQKDMPDAASLDGRLEGIESTVSGLIKDAVAAKAAAPKSQA